MAITLSTDRLRGLVGVTVDNVYARIQSVTVKNYDNGGGSEGNDPMFRLLYDVTLFGSASIRNATGEYPEWRNRLESREIDHMTCEVTVAQMNADGANCYTLAYADLKTRLASTVGPDDENGDPTTIAPIANNISDVV